MAIFILARQVSPALHQALTPEWQNHESIEREWIERISQSRAQGRRQQKTIEHKQLKQNKRQKIKVKTTEKRKDKIISAKDTQKDQSYHGKRKAKTCSFW